MDAIFAMIGIGLVVMIIVGSIMGIIASVSVGRLQTQVYALKRQVELLQHPRTDVSIEKPVAETPQSAEPVRAPERPTPSPVSSSPTANIPEQAETLESTTMATPGALKAKDSIKVAPPKASQSKRSFEETLGAQWSVWVGGLALLLGAVFLLRYTIEAGFFSPAIRVTMAVIFGLFLLCAGEVLRRGDSKIAKKLNTDALEGKAYIPGVLTAVGIFALLGSTYAAYALYGFIGPEVAFILMGAVSLCGLGFGLLHGPSLAALGLLASLVTPLLIQTTEPNAYILFTYLTIVSFAALALAIKRDWGWLIALTLFGALAWLFVTLQATTTQGTYFTWLAFAGLMYTISTVLGKTPVKKSKSDGLLTLSYGPRLACLWAALVAVLFLAAADKNAFNPAHFSAGLAFSVILMATAWIKPEQSWHVITGGLLGGLLILMKADFSQVWAPYFLMSLALMAVFIYLCYTRLYNDVSPTVPQTRDILWPFLASLWPIIICLAWIPIIPSGEKALGFALYGLSVILVYCSLRVWKNGQGKTSSSTVFVIGGAAAFGLAGFVTWSNLFECLALMSGLVIWASLFRRLPKEPTRMLTAGFGVVTLLNALFILLVNAQPVAQTLIFNELWIYFALPAVLCAGSAYWLSRDYNDLWSEGLKALALTFTALFFILQIRHAMNDGNLLAERFSFEEMAMQVLVGLSFTLGGTMITSRENQEPKTSHAHLIPNLAMGVSLFTMAVFVLGLCLSKAPLFHNHITISGHTFFNSLIPGYLLPAILFGMIAALSVNRRPKAFVKLTGSLSLLAALYYLTSQIRRSFSGSNISIFENRVEGIELYTISIAWLILGIIMLVAGMRIGSKSLRLGSAAVIILTVLKAFLIDMASLEGVLRAVSFVVLGLVLILIGRAYQRILMSDKTSRI